ncbi:uncharacterized protein ACN63O_022149 [Diretmus argenteus]
MAGASDPLEDMLFNEVDEKAVSDLVGSLESQLGRHKTPAASAGSFSDLKRDGAAGAVAQFPGKVRDQAGSLEPPQQGHPKAGLNLHQEPGATEALSGKPLRSSTSSTSSLNPGSGLQPLGASTRTVSPGPGPGPLTLPTQSAQSAATSFNRAPGPAPSPITSTSSTTTIPAASPGLQSLNGNTGAVKLVSSPAVPPPSGANTVISSVTSVTAGGSNIIGSIASQSGFPGPQSSVASVASQRHPSVSQNGVEPKGAAPPPPAASTSSSSSTTPQVLNHSNSLLHGKMLVPGQPGSGSVILGSSTTPQPVAVQSPVTQTQTGAGGAVTLAAGVKPAVNGVGQPAVSIVRPPGGPGGPVMAAPIQQQRPGMVASAVRTAAPQLAVRPQQQTTIQLPPGFTIPPGMVLVRTETGQLVMVPQQVLAQAQAKTQQGQTVANISPRPAAPTAGATIRVSTPSPVPGPSQTVRLASPGQTRMVQSPSAPTGQVGKAVTVAPGGAAVKMTTPQKAPTVITAGGQAMAKPAGVQPNLNVPGVTPAAATTPAARPTVVSQEMQENVKKCKNFLATLIKLASHNSPSPDTSKNVKSLVQDLLDAKIEPEEFTTRLQAELKSSPQPYLIPFLKKSLPALRQSLLNNQNSLVVPAPSTSTPPMGAPGIATATTTTTTTTIRPRMPTVNVRLAPPLANTMSVRRPGVQTVQTRMPMVITQSIRPQGAVVRGPTVIAGKTSLSLAAQANQRKLSDPGGGTFRDDDDINDVASMAGVNLSEENARILATSSELVGTKIRSCKDEAFLPVGLLHRRIMDTAKKLGVTEVPVEVVNYISHATQSRLRSLLEKVSAVAQHRSDGGKDEDVYEQSSDVRSQLRFFETLERMEKQRKDEQEREILLKAAKLLKNGRFPDADKDFAQLTSCEVSCISRATSVDSNLSGVFTTEELSEAMSKLKLGKSPGRDNIHPEFVIHQSTKTSRWLCAFFTACYQRLKLPKIWRRASVIALPKPNKDPEDPKSYRPISLLSVPFKILERMIHSRIEPVVDSQLPREQAGFRRGRSTADQVTLLSQDIENSFHDNEKAGVVYLDLTAAYDTVWHRGLHLKLLRTIPDRHMVKFIMETLSNRSFILQTSSGQCSRLRRLRNGVPQGSVLSPMLFNIYIHDLPDTSSTKYGYADDLAIMLSQPTWKAMEDGLNEDMDTMVAYLRRWRLQLSVGKTVAAAYHLSTREAKRELKVSVDGKLLEVQQAPKYLGVRLDRTLSFSQHLQELKAKSLRE